LSGATPWALFASLARYRRKKIMVLLKRNLEGFRVRRESLKGLEPQ
jgi:hypothetical protein